MHQLQQDIATQSSLLTSEQAFEDYLITYYWHYINYGSYHIMEWYFHPRVPEDYLLADTEFWDKVLGKIHSHLTTLAYTRQERLKKAMGALQEEATENERLHQRDTFEKVIAEVREKTLTKRRYVLGQFWTAFARVHQLKSKYAIYPAIQQFHAHQYQHLRSVTREPGNDVLFWQPVRSRKKQGIIDERARVDELVAEPLALEAESSREQILVWLPDYASWGEERSQVMLLAAWDQARWSYAELRRIDCFLADKTALLKDYYAEIGKYAKNRGLWEHLNNEQVEDNVWRSLDKELRRNAFLAQMDTVDKLIQLRRNALRKKIILLTEGAEAYKAGLPHVERNIEEEIASIEQQRSAFCAYVRHILELLIDDPGPLGERRIPKESDTREKLLNLQKRQALVRITGDINQQPRKYTMKTLDVPQAAKPDEVERRLHQIREQTRMKYGRPRGQVEQELQSPTESPDGERKPVKGEEDYGSWYEE